LQAAVPMTVDSPAPTVAHYKLAERMPSARDTASAVEAAHRVRHRGQRNVTMAPRLEQRFASLGTIDPAVYATYLDDAISRAPDFAPPNRFNQVTLRAVISLVRVDCCLVCSRMDGFPPGHFLHGGVR
jgi:hypothetical protein